MKETNEQQTAPTTQLTLRSVRHNSANTTRTTTKHALICGLQRGEGDAHLSKAQRVALLLMSSLLYVATLSKGGSNDISNIQPLCQSCNSKKGIRTIRYLPCRKTHTPKGEENRRY